MVCPFYDKRAARTESQGMSPDLAAARRAQPYVPFVTVDDSLVRVLPLLPQHQVHALKYLRYYFHSVGIRAQPGGSRHCSSPNMWQPLLTMWRCFLCLAAGTLSLPHRGPSCPGDSLFKCGIVHVPSPFPVRNLVVSRLGDVSPRFDPHLIIPFGYGQYLSHSAE